MRKLKPVFSAIYIEQQIADTERVQQLLQRFPDIPHISCERYGEIFNRRAQSFRLQKQKPALILAKKQNNFVLPAPEGYGYDASRSFYFSHMLNCVYDCRYCFLQGMYNSAHYVLFVNYEDFAAEMDKLIASNEEPCVFYSGYDCDSLALEPVSQFVEYFIPLLADHPDAAMEIRTKSTQVRYLLEAEPLSNCVIAMSFTSEDAYQQWEHKVPSIDKRLDALSRLQARGWPVAIRFEPLIYQANMLVAYQSLFEKVKHKLDTKKLHSVSTGLFRMPRDFYKNIVKLYPDDALFAAATKDEDGMVSLQHQMPESNEQETLQAIEAMLFDFISPQQYYRCG